MVPENRTLSSGGPLLLMELAFLLRGVGAEVYWMTIQKPVKEDEVVYNLEQKMLDRGVQVINLIGHQQFEAMCWCYCYMAFIFLILMIVPFLS